MSGYSIVDRPHVWEDKRTGRQEDRRTGRQEDRKKGRQKNFPDASAHRELTEEGDHYDSDDYPSVPVLPLAEDNRNSIEEAFEVEDVLGSDLSNSLLFLPRMHTFCCR